MSENILPDDDEPRQDPHAQPPWTPEEEAALRRDGCSQEEIEKGRLFWEWLNTMGRTA